MLKKIFNLFIFSIIFLFLSSCTMVKTNSHRYNNTTGSSNDNNGQNIASSTKEITAFSILGLPATVEGLNIYLTLPFGSSVSSLVPTITHTGSSIYPASGIARNFVEPVTYTVTAGDGSTEVYTVTVTVAALNVLSPDKEITSFSILGASGNIIGTNISVTLPSGTNVTSLSPNLTISNKASVNPGSGISQNFTNPIVYTVTAEDGSTENYTVTVIVANSSYKEITSFSILGILGTRVGTNISVIVPYGTVVSSLTPTIVYTGLSVNPASGLVHDFTNPVIYTVTAADSSSQQYTVTVTVSPQLAGDKVTFSADGISFNFVYVPGGLSFPVNIEDSESGTVANAYWIGETKVTYELWNTVKTWATSNGYTFSNTGVKGSWGSGSVMQPVTTINWRDAVIFSNALTEWYNAKKGTTYTCAYYSNSGYTTPIRVSTNVKSLCSTLGCQDKPYVKASATGFRLLNNKEFELAARYIGTTAPSTSPLSTERKTTSVGGVTYYWTPGDYASGANADYTNATATRSVAWYNASGTQAVALLNPNSLGLYDMSGNAFEWNYDYMPSTSYRIWRGGSWYFYNPFYLVVSADDYNYSYEANINTGFRLGKTAF
ncbi:MAG: DUF5018 domain-containing protein [bacterium]